VKFIVKVQFKGGKLEGGMGPAIVERYAFNRGGLMDMAEDIRYAMVCKADSVTAGDGYVTVRFLDFPKWLKLSQSAMECGVAKMLIDAREHKRSVVNGVPTKPHESVQAIPCPACEVNRIDAADVDHVEGGVFAQESE
jgi:hypothetical protein